MTLELTDKEIVERLKDTKVGVLAEELGVSRNVIMYHAAKVSCKHRYNKLSTIITKDRYANDILSQYTPPVYENIEKITAVNWFNVFRAKYRVLFNESYINYVASGLVQIKGKDLIKKRW